MTGMRALGTTVRLIAIALLLSSAPAALAASKADSTRMPRGRKNLQARDATARMLGPKARAILVFPSIVKAGFMFGGQIGDGVLF